MARIKTWPVLSSVYTAMRLDDNMQYARAKERVMQIVNQERDAVALEKMKAMSAPKMATTNMDNVFSMTSNSITMNMDEFLAMRAGTYGAKSNADVEGKYSNGKCWRCGVTGHRRADCPLIMADRTIETQLILNSFTVNLWYRVVLSLMDGQISSCWCCWSPWSE